MKKPKPKIVHVMADGRKLDSIEGHVVPAGNAAYRIIYECAIREREKRENLA